MEQGTQRSSHQTPVQAYEFGVFTVEVPGGELRKHGTRVKLQERPVQLLIALLERPGDVVSREELRQQLWPDGTFVDFDHNISSAINKLRTVLNDSATHPRFIETVGRKGYRFLADVKRIDVKRISNEPAAHRTEEPKIQEVTAASKEIHTRFGRLSIIAAGAILLLVIALLGYFQWRRGAERTAITQQRVMLAVLPFENLTGDPQQEYFSDGLTEEMIAELGRLNQDRLGVIARTSVMLYKQSPKSLDQIGRELGVQYVIEGSVRRDSTRVRITAQLIQVKDQTHVWAKDYDRELSSSLTLESEIAREIGDEIQSRLGYSNEVKRAVQRTSERPTVSYEAYDLYLKGRYFWNKRTPAGFLQAAEYFQQAIAKDPGYARPYAGLADTYGLMTTWYLAPQQEYMPKAREAALKALALDDSLAEAHASLALVAESYDYDWQAAQREFRRAIELNADYATGHQWYAEYLAWQGRFDDAFAESEKARQLDPMSLIIATDQATILYYSRNYDRAIAQCRAVLDMDPGFSHARKFVVMSYVWQGKFEQALKENDLMGIGEDSPWTWASRALIYNYSGATAEAQHALKKFEELTPRLREEGVLERVIAYNGSSQKEKTISLLEDAYKEHSPALTNLKVDPKYDFVRNDPRFQQLLSLVGLNQ